MSTGIFLLDDQDQLSEMSELPFAAEVDLQRLLANHPNLLAGDQIDPENPRRWLLVAREMGIPDLEQGGARWALDHLFLDQDGVPTLVEVKRGGDPRVRRDVIGQLLGYAANSVLFWTEEMIRDRFEDRCRAESMDADQQLGVFLRKEGDSAAAAEFWQRVRTNLQARKIRLLFVADDIPAELRPVVEFLNQQMESVEVLAVEIRQYAVGNRKTLVPRVFGQTSEALGKKSGGPRPAHHWDEASFFADLSRRRGAAEADVARQLLGWAGRAGCRIWWGKGAKDGSFFPMVDHEGNAHWTIAVWTYGRVEIQFQMLLGKPPFAAEAKRVELLEKLNTALGDAMIPRDGIDRRPSVPLRILESGAVMEAFLKVLDWLLVEIRAA
jgi:hypothetical protein